jgi:hypothetical protein
MRLSKLFRTTDEVPERPGEAASGLSLDGWQGHWPVDDTPAEDAHADVPMMLNPQGPPTIAPS